MPLAIFLNHLLQVIITVEDLQAQALRIWVITHHALYHVAPSRVVRGEQISLIIERHFGQQDVMEEGLLVGPRMVVTEADQLVRTTLVDVIAAGVAAAEVLSPGREGLLADFMQCMVPLYGVWLCVVCCVNNGGK